MSFSRVNVAGWATNQVLTSAQINALDIDHANAADKTTNNDTIAGVWTFQSGAGCVFSPGAGIVLNGSGCLLTGSVNAIQVGVAGGLVTTAAGALCLGGGSADWPTFQGTGGALLRSRTMWQAADQIAGVSCLSGAPLAITAANAKISQVYGFSAGAAGNPVQGSGGFQTTAVSGAVNPYAYLLPLRQLHNGAVSGATLQTATIQLIGSASGGLPAVMPAIGIFRTSATTSVSGAVSLLAAGSPTGYQSDTSGSLGAYSTLHTITYTPTQNNLIDTTQYNYYMVILDGCSTNATVGAIYFGVSLSFVFISNMGW